jgi:hypothetical protein
MLFNFGSEYAIRMVHENQERLEQNGTHQLLGYVDDNIHDDSKLLSGFPWPIIFKSEINKLKLLMEYESATQKVLIS